MAKMLSNTSRQQLHVLKQCCTWCDQCLLAQVHVHLAAMGRASAALGSRLRGPYRIVVDCHFTAAPSPEPDCIPLLSRRLSAYLVLARLH